VFKVDGEQGIVILMDAAIFAAVAGSLLDQQSSGGVH
jgi:hypothetical protein